MAQVLLGILGLAILASFFVAYMSSKTWPIYQAVLVVFVFLGLVTFFYLGARTLATHRNWRNLVEQQAKELANLQSQTVPLTGGIDASGYRVAGTIPQLKHELELLTSKRGGVYYNAAAEGLKNGVVQLTLKPASLPKPVDPNAPAPEPGAPAEAAQAEAPPPEAAQVETPAGEKPAEEATKFIHGLAPNALVYAFDQKPFAEGGRYLGEFKVVTAPEGSPAVQVQPNLPLTAAQTKRLEAAAKGTWTLYTTMPLDDASVFSGLDDAARQKLLTGETAAEYAKADRPLRDYQVFFQENYVQRSLVADAISKTNAKIERLQAATKEVEKEIGYRETEKTNLAADLERFQFEVKAIAAYEKTVEGTLASTLAQLRAIYIENRQAAAAIARDQLQAAQSIDSRAGAAPGSR